MIDATQSLSQIQQAIHREYGTREYALYHAPRFAVLLKLVKEYAPTGDPKILDVGISEFADMVRDTLGCNVDTLDIFPPLPMERGKQYEFDLNNCDKPDRWPTDLPQYDVIVLAEVVEHLYASPLHAFRLFLSLLKPGGVLLVQTPNAVALHKRVKMLFGRNPYMLIYEKDKHAGHVREYTLKELENYSRNAGFEVVRSLRLGYFDYRYIGHAGVHVSSAKAKLANFIANNSPPSLRPGLTLVLRRPK